MTGHNHYSNCTCGWCVNYGATRINRSQIAAEFSFRDARKLLELNAVRTISACYVNPNARCPVCDAAVFFYANQHGSRVYFDELGHPWPKHPCTDNNIRSFASRPTIVAPSARRKRGLALELVAAAGTTGMFDVPGGGHEGWRLMEVISTENHDKRHVVTAEGVELDHLKRTFSYLAPDALILFGSFISLNGDLISFLHPESLTNVTFFDGAAIEPAVEDLGANNQHEPELAPPVLNPVVKKTRLIKNSARRDGTHADLTEAETFHFNGPKNDVAQLCERLGPVVKIYAQSGTRKPRDVAVQLNKDGHRTAAGAIWTSRLAQFLLALIFSDTSGFVNTEAPSASRQSSRMQQRDRNREPQALGDIASSLSTLGRVTVRKK